MLFYCTLIFSLVFKTHLWLVTGALTTALAYSGAAAVHACLMAGRGPSWVVELDKVGVTIILHAASLIAALLLNWSDTLRRLGARFAATKDEKGEFALNFMGQRTVVVYWAILVWIGLACMWCDLTWDRATVQPISPDMSQVICRPGTTNSAPPSAYDTLTGFVDRQFIRDNGCSNPCDQIDIPSIFRQKTDLHLMAEPRPLEGHFAVVRKLSFISRYTVPWIFLESLILLSFGRRSPREIRNLIYLKLFLRGPQFEQPMLVAVQDWAVRVFAVLTYGTTVAMFILCPFLFAALVTWAEWTAWMFPPDAEFTNEAGQWQPWVIAGLVIFAAMIAKYHDIAVSELDALWQGIWCQSSHRRQHDVTMKESTASYVLESALKDAEERFREYCRTKPLPNVPRRTRWANVHQDMSLVKKLLQYLRHIGDPISRTFGRISNRVREEARDFFQWSRDPRSVSQRANRNLENR